MTEEIASPRTMVKRRLLDDYNISISKKNLYRGICAYNDSIAGMANFTAVVSTLNSDERELGKFARYILSRA